MSPGRERSGNIRVVRDGVLQVQVRPVSDPTAPGEWIAATRLREVGGRP